jgi:predicted nucleic acid-binding protein
MRLLLSDCSVLLNLLAADCVSALAENTGWRIAICPAVQDEVIKLRNPHTGEMERIDLQPSIDSGLLQICDLEGAAEEELYVNQAAILDDGEAMSIAIAACRNWDLGIDDKQASNYTKRMFPGVPVWSTPDILRKWEGAASLPTTELQRCIQLIEARARYFPARSHPLNDWWSARRDGC